ncbi:MAG: short-chain dehydrogenase [Ponticaulis sp.]|nr:short-chain dehydrogenase [Ponticaulis sp.]
MPEARGRKSIFITGAASGIGAETARLFANRGWFIGLYDINETGLADMQEEIGPDNCITGNLDVRDRKQWHAAVASFADATEKRMNVLFNNAGIAETGWFEDIRPEMADAIVDINLKGVINGVYACLPLLKETAGARIVNTASSAGLAGTPRLSVYSATKFAVRGLTESLNLELADEDIYVTSLTPWFIDTPILDSGAVAGANRSGKDSLLDNGVPVYPVSMAAERAWEAAHGRATHYLVGKAAQRMSFASRFLPGSVRKRLRKSLPKRGLQN